MPKPDQAPGQQKTHTVRDADGNESQMTQEDWRNRDKAAGYTRPDDDEAAEQEEAPAEEPA